MKGRGVKCDESSMRPVDAGGTMCSEVVRSVQVGEAEVNG